MTKIKLRIEGMHCTSCAMNIDGELEDTEGVKNSSTHYAKQESEVEFDEDKVMVKDIVKIIEKTGYKASLL
ncbi:MAG: heavy-metal-associated domain-containing protein [Candidatus Levybacteria bacterium]|nr:heavy-metal-associated domain-containing protein [Candidatus Levybacteria bacterium]